MENFKKVASEVLSRLEFPLAVVDSDGSVLAATGSAAAVVPELRDPAGSCNFMGLLAEPPDSFAEWLARVGNPTPVRLRRKNGNPDLSLTIMAHPLAPEPPLNECWVLNFLLDGSVSRQNHEREILREITSVPIPEMASEGRMLVPEFPEANPISRKLLATIVGYLEGDAALLVRLDNFMRPSVIGQCGFSPSKMSGVLEEIAREAEAGWAAEGLIREAVKSGHSLSVDPSNEMEPLLGAMARGLTSPPREIWVDGIAGFGVVFIFFSKPPSQTVRNFASDAVVRLGRHLEATTYSNNMFEAFVELQKTQEQIIQTGKMAAIGELATGVAHELRQPITAINNFLTTILDHLEADRIGKIKERLDEFRTRFRRNADRLSRITDHLLKFGRQERLQTKPTNVHELVEEIFGTFLETNFAQEGIAVELKIAPDMPLVEMDAARIEQVVLTLFSNARDALAGTAEPRVTLRAEVRDERFRLTVEDNGHGIEDAHLDKVLNPFFTTKPVGKGTGIGLSISHAIVRGHHGNFFIANNPEGGASFTVDMPITQPRPAESTPGGGGA